MSDKFREIAIDRDTGGVAIYWFTPAGRLRRIDLTRAEAFKALAQLALGLAETEARDV